MRIGLRQKHRHLAVDLQRDGTVYRATIDGIEHVVDAGELDAAVPSILVDGRRYRIDLVRSGRDRLVAVDGEIYTFLPESGAAPAHAVPTVAPPEIVAPMPGTVLQVHVQPGDRVAAGDALIVLEAMKMETRLTAEAAATVTEVRVAAGDMVDGGQVLVVLAYEDDAAA